ncbi:MAG: hypothetical protein V3V28_05915, partial [Polaribacter sp.]|uniref:hypothetical protein n=1 Tax=Polaribacter sp. TaxID=1920175 RepID=UPI002F35604D
SILIKSKKIRAYFSKSIKSNAFIRVEKRILSIFEFYRTIIIFNNKRNQKTISDIMKKLLLILFFTILLFSCGNQKQKFNNNAKYYDSGNIKEKWFFGKMIFDSISYQDTDLKNILIDSTKVLYFDNHKNTIGGITFYFQKKHKTLVFYLNGVLGREGYAIKDSLAIGIWKHYNRDGKLKSYSQFKNIKGKSYLNQNWHHNKDGDTIGGYYFNMPYIKGDTIKLSEEFKFFVQVPVPYFQDKSKILVCTSASDTLNFNSDFSNKGNVPESCAYDIETNSDDMKFAPDIKHSHASMTFKKFKTPGNKLVRGIIYEYLVKEKDSLGLEKALENAHKMYFEIPVFVKDSV